MVNLYFFLLTDLSKLKSMINHYSGSIWMDLDLNSLPTGEKLMLTESLQAIHGCNSILMFMSTTTDIQNYNDLDAKDKIQTM